MSWHLPPGSHHVRSVHARRGVGAQQRPWMHDAASSLAQSERAAHGTRGHRPTPYAATLHECAPALTRRRALERSTLESVAEQYQRADGLSGCSAVRPCAWLPRALGALATRSTSTLDQPRRDDGRDARRDDGRDARRHDGSRCPHASPSSPPSLARSCARIRPPHPRPSYRRVAASVRGARPARLRGRHLVLAGLRRLR